MRNLTGRDVFLNPDDDFFINRLIILDDDDLLLLVSLLLLLRDTTFKTAIQNSSKILGPPNSNDVTTRISLCPQTQHTKTITTKTISVGIDDDNVRPSVSSDTLAMKTLNKVIGRVLYDSSRDSDVLVSEREREYK